MRKVSREALWCFLVASCVCASVAKAGDFFTRSENYGVTLPQTVLPNGADEVRTADGTSCRSAVGGDGAYADFGVIGAPDNTNTALDCGSGSVAVYGRVVVPLGGRSERLDCTKLYELEIQRLKMQLHLARMGANGKQPTRQDEAEVNEAWRENATQTASAAAATAVKAQRTQKRK